MKNLFFSRDLRTTATRHVRDFLLLNSILLSFFLNPVLAQDNFSTETISIRDGLSSTFIRDIIQDKYGYMWISTNDGVNIYDGYTIKVLKNTPDDSSSLPSNDTYRMLEDSQGTLWISTLNGLARYNRASKSFTTFRPNVSAGERPNMVINLCEDSKNNFWVTTLMGTMQFDRESGKFTGYDVMLSDNSIAAFSNYSGCVIETDKEELYCISQGFGLLRFDYGSQLFIQVPLKDNFNDKIEASRYTRMIATKENDLLLAYSNGLAQIDLDENKGYDLTPFQRRVAQNRFVDNAASGLFIDRNEKMWVGTGLHGIYLYDQQTEKFTRTSFTSSAFYYSSFTEDNSGILWFASSRGVTKYDFDRKPFQTFTLSNDVEQNSLKAVSSFSASSTFKDHLWLATAQGVYLFNHKENRISGGAEKSAALSAFEKYNMTAIKERDGNLWIATALDGLYALNLKSGNINSFRRKIYDPASLIDDRVQSLEFNQDGNLWIGTNDGLHLLRTDKNEIRLVPSFLNRTYNKALLSKIKSLRKNSSPVSSIIEVGDFADISKEFVVRKDGKFIIYSVGEGLDFWNMVDFGWLESSEGDTIWDAVEFSETFHETGAEKNRIKIGLLELKTGRYKLRYKSDDSHSLDSYNQLPPMDSTYWGIQLFTLNNDDYDVFQKELQSSKEKTFLKGENIQVLFNDSQNNMWVGTTDGISRIDTNLVIKNYYNSTLTKNTLSNDRVRDISEDLKGNIWIATADGLNKFNPVTKTFSVIRESDGLPTSNLAAIEVDSHGDLWVSGLKGVSKLEIDDNIDKPIIVNFDVKDGLQGYEFTANSSYKDAKGQLYFAGLDGFNAFYPGNSNKTPPQLAIQNINVSNKSIISLDDFHNIDINSISEIGLDHDQNNISFEFASIHFSRPDKNRLLYKMDGVDEEWQVGDRRFASYTNLSPGDYTFNLQGSNGDGVWSKEVKKINIAISAPWYNNWIAYTAYVLLFAGLLFSVRKVEIERQQKNARLTESQLRAETAEAKALAAQAENERKTRELEEARALQLSMLPKELPQLPNLDIAVYMQTATEVGGDYYDFHVGLDGTLTVVIGDATGHGMRAGTMVTTAKSLFNSYAPNPDILFSFQEITRCIRQMNFGKMSMCMTMLKIKGNKMQMSTAGMPPSFIFRRDTQVMEEHLFKAMPLGTMDKFPYEIKDTTLKSGDTILLLSDGLPELKNKEDKMYGYKKVRNVFEEIADKSPEDIVSHLKNEGAGWVDNADPDDDVTFVVIKVK